MPLSTVSMDVRPGGSWRATMFADAGRHEIRWKGEYREVVEPERLVFTISDQPGDDAYELSPSSSPTSATAAPRCTSSSAAACRPSSTSAPGKAGRPSSTASPSAWPAPEAPARLLGLISPGDRFPAGSAREQFLCRLR